MEHRLDTVDPASLAPPYRVLFEGLRAENAALTERNRALERREPEAVVEGLRSRVASLAEHNRRLEHLLRELRRAMFGKKSESAPGKLVIVQPVKVRQEGEGQPPPPPRVMGRHPRGWGSSVDRGACGQGY